MLKALVIKELREAAGIVALALVAWAFMLYAGAGLLLGLWPSLVDNGGFPFVSDSFGTRYTLIMGSLAIALGFRQSAREAAKDTYQFLLHRPAGRRFIFGTKLLVGGGLTLVPGGLAIFAYALWAAKPGNSPTPFFWSMAGTAGIGAMCMLPVYLAAFLSGLRPARWFGTRLAPVLAASGIAFALSFLSWWTALVSLAILAAIIVASIFYTAQTRDY